MTTFDTSSPQGFVGLRINGNENLRAEDLRAYELGWRWRPLQRVSFDAAIYRHDYDHLIGGTGGVPTFELLPIPALYVDLLFVNLQSARVDGAEALVEWAAAPWVRFEAQGNWIQTQVDGSPTGPVDPEESYSLRAQFDLADDVELDLSWRSIGRLTGMGPTIPSYDSMNLRVAWRMMPNIELSVSVANALDNEHVEFTQDLALAPGVSIGRTAFARLVWSPAQ